MPNNNVFINCPFDDDYRQMLLATVFTVKYLGFIPTLTLQNADSSQTRLDKIVELIDCARFGIHDLSRMQANEKGELARMNMPFELGIDYGCKRFKEGAKSNNQILVLATTPYQYQAALSDLAGSDIKYHEDDPIKTVSAIRNWFVNIELNRGPSGSKIWFDFNEFTSDLEEQLLAGDFSKKEYDELQVSEVMDYMDEWIAQLD